MRRGWSRNEAPLLIRIRWWLEDLRGLSPLSRLRERVDEVRGAPTDGRVVLGSLLALVLLVGGGFAAARALAGASGGESSKVAATGPSRDSACPVRPCPRQKGLSYTAAALIRVP